MRRVASAAPAIAAMPAAPSATPSGAFVVPSPVWLSFEVFAAVSLPFFSSPSALGRLTGSCAGAVGSSREGLLLFATSFVGSCRPDPGVVSGLSGGVVLSGGFVSSGGVVSDPAGGVVFSGFDGDAGGVGAALSSSGFGVSSGSACPAPSFAGGAGSFGALGGFPSGAAGGFTSGGRTLSGGFVSPEGASPLPSSGGVFPTGGTAGESAAGGSSSTGGTVGFSGSRLRHSSFSCLYLFVQPSWYCGWPW